MEKEKVDIIINKIEFILGFELPKEFKEFYTNEIETNKTIQFMDLYDIYNEVVMASDKEICDELYEVEPEKSILKKAYDKKRIPFIKDDSGNYVGIDYNPGECGILGQIINYGGDEYRMIVYANCFADFIEGIKNVNLPKDEYIIDYLDKNNLNFRKDISLTEIPQKIKTENVERIKIVQNEINEVILKKEINMQNMKKIIDILQNMNEELINNLNIKIYKNYCFDYRIIDKRDSFSRTMGTERLFYDKLSSYNKEEIKGYSFAIANYMEDLQNDKIMIGEEKIFVEINMILNQILVRYTQTIKNQIMKDKYEEIIKYIRAL